MSGPSVGKMQDALEKQTETNMLLNKQIMAAESRIKRKLAKLIHLRSITDRLAQATSVQVADCLSASKITHQEIKSSSS